MQKQLSDTDLGHFHRAIELALQAEVAGNLPIGCVITLGEELVAEGKNTIWVPEYDPRRHAELEAITNVPRERWSEARKMTLYTTLEPCLMCASTILHHSIGRVLFGTVDPYGGSGCALGYLPPFYEEQLAFTHWSGPVFPQACNPLYRRARKAIEARRSLPG